MENTPVFDSASLTSDEKMFALLSHLSVVLGGILLPIIFWATQKDKSKFVRFHSLQSIFYHIAIAVIVIFLIILLAVGILLGALVTGVSISQNNESITPVFLGLFMILFYAVLFIILFASIGYGVYLGVKAYQGNLVKIPIIGNIIYRKVYGGL